MNHRQADLRLWWEKPYYRSCRKRLPIVVFLTSILLVGCQASGNVVSLQSLEVHVINVGQGDAVLIRCPEGIHELLIDSGERNSRYPESATEFKTYLEKKQDKTNKIEVVIATHPHSDHLGSMAWVIKEYSIGLYLDNGISHDSATYREVNKAMTDREVLRKNIKEVSLPDIDFCPLADVSAKILRPKGYEEDEDNLNNRSVIVRVDFKEDSFLFVGDTELEAELLLLNDPETKKDLDCDFLKAGHHGSATSSSKEFLAAVTPNIVAISCGKKDTGSNKGYKHPRYEVVKALLEKAGPRESPITIDAYDTANGSWTKIKLPTAVYVTAAEGTLIFESDGSNIKRK